MFGWRKRNEGFEWREYVRTTVLVRRADRQRRLDDVRMAALAKVKDTRDRGVEAGKVGLDRTLDGLKAVARSAATGLWTVLNASVRALGGALSALWANMRALAARVPIPKAAVVMPQKLAAWSGRMRASLPRFPARRVLSVQSLIGAGAIVLAVLVFGRLFSPADVDVAPRPAPHVVTAAVTDTSDLSEIGGRATAVSGDLLRVGGRVVRLNGIEAPESRQHCLKTNGRRWPCGGGAVDALNRLVRGKSVICEVSGSDDQGRPIAGCHIGETDIAAALVRAGHVFAKTGFFRSYSSQEDAAKAEKAGLWQGNAERPAEWRARLWEEAKRVAPEGCPIKGYIRASGRIYAMPWSDEYAGGRIRAVRGERWFCSEDEARAAGFKLADRS